MAEEWSSQNARDAKKLLEITDKLEAVVADYERAQEMRKAVWIIPLYKQIILWKYG